MGGPTAKKDGPDPLVEARRAAVDVAHRLRSRGESWTALARRLRISPRSLFSWRTGEVGKRPLGRPAEQLDHDTREWLDELLRSVGPDIGIPTLRGMLPGTARAALERHLRHYRRGHRRRRRIRLYRLTWRRPGAIWAVDLANPPNPVDGLGRAILAVRDLASRYTLGWISLPRGNAASVSVAVQRLFRRHGAPLVLKSDNGSCFVARTFRLLLARTGVVHLRSPRAWPQYNGACEAGIGVLKALTDTAAAGRGEPEDWTSDDLEEARARSNELSRQIGKAHVSAQKQWSRRKRIARLDRTRLRREIARQRQLLAKETDRQSRPMTRRRKALEAALIHLGYLEVSNVWIRARSKGSCSNRTYR